MLKGKSKQQAEQDEVLGRCIEVISKIYLDKPLARYAQFSSQEDLNTLINRNKRKEIDMSVSQVKDEIMTNGYKLKALLEDDLLKYYLV